MDLATALAASGQDEAAHAELTRPLGRHPGCVPARELMTRLRPLKPGTHVWRLQNQLRLQLPINEIHEVV